MCDRHQDRYRVRTEGNEVQGQGGKVETTVEDAGVPACFGCLLIASGKGEREGKDAANKDPERVESSRD